MNREELIKIINNDYDFLTKLSIQEYILVRNWKQLNKKYPLQSFDQTDLFVNDNRADIQYVKNNIWIPNKPDDYLDLDIDLIIANHDKRNMRIWNILRDFGSTLWNNNNFGRNIYAMVVDKVTGKYLGIICIGEDVMNLKPRDDFLGWKRPQKSENKMIDYLVIGSTLVPTQPFGFNYVGGKLMALLMLSDKLHKAWYDLSGKELVGYTTTSLYGSYSQYSSLKYWKKRGKTEGMFPLEPTDEVWKEIKLWMLENYPEISNKILNANWSKTNLLRSALLKLKIPIPTTGFQKGVYFCELYENTKAYLRMETKNLGNKNFDNSIGALIDLWKTKYAIKRVNNLLSKNNYNTNTLFYDDILSMSWDETKIKYLSEVGR